MRRLRTTKEVASRIDPTYIRDPQKLIAVRRVIVTVCCLAVVGWWALYFARGDQTLYSPGPVAHSHAMFEADCAQCHNPGPAGGFIRIVSDSACLKCHDGPLHHENQATMATRVIGLAAAVTSPATPATAPSELPHHRSTNCAGCHVEHRGHEVLMARDDAHCTQCHQNVSTVSAKPPEIWPNVTGFTLATHPPFGRRLTEPKQWSRGSAKEPLLDSTPLKFNHAVHMPLVPARAGQTSNCTICHEPASTASPDGRRYMKPVSYQSNCASCHTLGVAGGIPISHAPLSTVRRELADLPGLHREWLLRQPPAVRAKELTREKKGPAPTFKITRTQITADVWAADKAKIVADDMATRYAERSAQIPGHEELEAAGPEAVTIAAGGPSASVLELITAYDPPTGTACAKCHTLIGQPWAAYQKALSAPASPASAPATTQAAPASLATAPTVLGYVPRRWFTGSHFDHDAHRSQSCLDCHAQATTSTLTSDVMLPKMESCIQCHHTPSAADSGAGAQCQTCHTFHDRSREGVHRD